jgi:hypothetical protein
MSAPRAEHVEVPDDPRDFLAHSIADRFGDGAPLLPPTDAAVDALLAAAPYPADHVVAVLPPRHGVATVELVAINAAMAGCEPAALPWVIAALEALSAPEWNAFGLTTTTSSVCPMLIANGPSRDRLGIDYRAGCMGGAGGRGSMTIGRAVALCLRNLGGQRAGETSRSVFGQPARFGLCFGEWEERSPWAPLAERRGVATGSDAVTVHGGKGTFPLADINNDDPLDLLLLIAKSLAFPLSNMYLGHQDHGEVVLAINPMWAERFAVPFPDVADLQAYLCEHAWQPLDLWPAATQEIMLRKGRATGPRVGLVARPDQIVPVVCGGLGSLHAVALPSFGESQLQTAAVPG